MYDEPIRLHWIVPNTDTQMALSNVCNKIKRINMNVKEIIIDWGKGGWGGNETGGENNQYVIIHM